jgi:hypothetical protein
MHIHTPLGIWAGSASRGWLRRNTKLSRAYSNVQTDISSVALVDNEIDGYDGKKPAITSRPARQPIAAGCRDVMASLAARNQVWYMKYPLPPLGAFCQRRV